MGSQYSATECSARGAREEGQEWRVESDWESQQMSSTSDITQPSAGFRGVSVRPAVLLGPFLKPFQGVQIVIKIYDLEGILGEGNVTVFIAPRVRRFDTSGVPWSCQSC